MHYSLEIREPPFLIHADVKNQKTFWYAPQLDGELRLTVSGSEPALELTVRIPATHDLPASLPALLAALEQIGMVLGAARVVEAPVADFAHAITAQGEHEKCIHEFQNKIDFLDDEAGRTGRMLTALEAHRLKVVAILAEPSFSEPLGPDLRVALTERFPNSTSVGRFEVRWRP